MIAEVISLGDWMDPQNVTFDRNVIHYNKFLMEHTLNGLDTLQYYLNYKDIITSKFSQMIKEILK